MSRITGSEVANLMEAYDAVYAPQELTEEQVWEEVENWVNSLLEEGYDLGEYTWEDMYEEYLSEAIGQPGSAGYVNWQDRNSGQVRSGYKSSSDGKLYKNYNDALAAKNSRMKGLAVQQGIERTFRAGGGNAAVAQGKSPLAVVTQGSTNLQRQQRPAAGAPAPAARPAAGAPAPTGAKPTATTTPTPSTSPARPSLSSQVDDIRKMRAKSLQRQGKPLEAATVSGTTQPAYQANSFDPFDVVLGHLIDEGYADTEEAALKIMANMSEEWRQSIVLDERNRGERDMTDQQVRLRRDRRDGDTTSGGFKPYVRAGGAQRADHERSRGTKKVKGRVSASMRGPNDNVSNYHASRGEN